MGETWITVVRYADCSMYPRVGRWAPLLLGRAKRGRTQLCSLSAVWCSFVCNVLPLPLTSTSSSSEVYRFSLPTYLPALLSWLLKPSLLLWLWPTRLCSLPELSNSNTAPSKINAQRFSTISIKCVCDTVCIFVVGYFV